MGRSARVTSTDVLQTTATGLQRFRGECAAVMDDLEIEIRRAAEWIHHDRKDYWAHELRRCEEWVSRANVQLQQARMLRRVAERDPACVDEKRELDRAKRRLDTARQKILAVQHWTYAIDRAIDAFQRSRIQFSTWLDTDVLQAIASLNRMSESLASYISLEAPASPHTPIVAGAAETPAETLPETSVTQGGPPPAGGTVAEKSETAR